MTEAIAVALISGAVSLIGILITQRAQANKFSHELDKNEAVLSEKIASMQCDIKEHNHYARLFAESMPVVKEQIKVLNHRVSDLENERRNDGL